MEVNRLNRLLMISFDAVGDSRVEELCAYPNFRELYARSAVARSVETVFLSNTYPIHTSVVTGVEPSVHGIVSNTEPFPKAHPRWHTAAREIRAKTLWQAAAEKGLKTAAVLWPVTAGAPEICYNIPEVMAPPGKSQVLTSLRAGSALVQLKEYLRHGKKMDGLNQPALDDFATACMTDILREKRPQLALMHLTAFDALCHRHGPGSGELARAFAALDRNLGLLLAAAGEDMAVLLFSDHSQLPVSKVLTPNDLLVEMGFMQRDAGGYRREDALCFIECVGGSAFLHNASLPVWRVKEVRSAVEHSEGFGRFLSGEELRRCGREQLSFGFSAAPGYCFEAKGTEYRGQHGYPLDSPDYKVFYLASGGGFARGRVTQGGSILDLAPIASRCLGLEMPGLGQSPEHLYDIVGEAQTEQTGGAHEG